LHSLSTKSPEAIGQELIQQAHHRDGIPEIVAGAFFLMAAALIYGQPYLPQDPAGRRATAIAIAVGVPSLLIAFKRVALPWLRQRYFIESFGYVQYNQWTSQRLFAGLAFVAVFALLVFGVAPTLDDPHRWRPILTALLMAGVLMDVRPFSTRPSGRDHAGRGLRTGRRRLVSNQRVQLGG
jgi:peptidoglycan/LPS O-acetylase OafA/YrhL